MSHCKKRMIAGAGAAGLVVITLLPYVQLIFASVQGESGWSFHAWYQIFFGSSAYLIRFWNSIFLCSGITAGQLMISILAGFGFARYHFPGRKVLLFFMMVWMILPVQATLVPDYLILDRLHVLNTEMALIMPGIFLPLGTIILTSIFQSVPQDVFDAARLDGCDVLRLILSFAVPICKGGIACVVLLSFADSWNMVEQPIAFLDEIRKYPLSVALAWRADAEPAKQIVCCLLAAIPPVLLFFFWNDKLTEGIEVMGVK